MNFWSLFSDIGGLAIIFLGQVGLGIWWIARQSGRIQNLEGANERQELQMQNMRQEYTQGLEKQALRFDASENARAQAESGIMVMLGKLTVTLESLQKSVEQLSNAEAARAANGQNSPRTMVDELKQYLEFQAMLEKMRPAQ